MTQKKIIPILLVVCLAAAGAFFGGMKYSQAQQTAMRAARSQSFGATGGPNGAGARGVRGTGGLLMGEVLSKDDKSMTLKLRDGGSKIIFFSDQTQVMKSTAGSAADLAAGQQVTATGSANTDGSVTAQSIQIRPLQAQGSNTPTIIK